MLQIPAKVESLDLQA